MPKYNLCIKCGSDEHSNKNCKNPVTSFGLVVYTLNNKPDFTKGRIYKTEIVNCDKHVYPLKDYNSISHNNKNETDPENFLFLLVERKDTIAFLNLIQGSYPSIEPHKTRKIISYTYELTCAERKKLLEYSFEELWKIAGTKKKIYEKAELKFNSLNIKGLLEKYNVHHQEGDYIMPKGRLKYGESILSCAIREFSEETGYSETDVKILNFPPLEETFVGTDGKIYKNVFFTAELNSNASIKVQLGDDPNQSKEVGNLGWFSFNECKEIMRKCHVDKIKIISTVLSHISTKSVSKTNHLFLTPRIAHTV